MSSTTGTVGPYVPPGARVSRFQRNLRTACAEGRIDCSVEAHHRERHWIDPPSGRRFSDVERKPLRTLYDMMMPGTTAKCACLKLACEAQWNRSFHGSYTTVAIQPGSYTKGLDNLSVVPKKIYSLRFTLKPDVYKFLVARFPEWYFVSRFAGSHDHPIAHVSTRIAGERLLDSLPRGTAAAPKTYVDMHGNPGSNEAYMARPGNDNIRILTMVECITPKDHIRKVVKWGPQFDAAGLARWHEFSIRDAGLNISGPFVGMHIDGFVSIHTAYYYDNAEIIRLLTTFRCPMYMAMHRFEHKSGVMNNGEQRYDKRVTASRNWVYQTNVLSGLVYDHPDNSVWYDHDSFDDGVHGVAWDANLLCDETFRFVASYCPAAQCRMSSRALQHAGVIANLVLPTSSHHTAPSQGAVAAANSVSLSMGGVTSTMPLRTELVDFFGEMRVAMVGRARTARQYSDHVSRCKVARSSVLQNKSTRMDAQELGDIALFSFYIDFCDQLATDNHMFGANYAKVLLADSLYRNGGGHVTTGCIAAFSNIFLAVADSKNLTQLALRTVRATTAEVMRKT